jgi:triacylglycerol esterase/lipase EstA (alpha/beta hydrolase family)
MHQSLLWLAFIGCSNQTGTATPTLAPPPPDSGDTTTGDTGDVDEPWSCEQIAPLAEGSLLRDATTVTGTAEACGERLHALIGARGARFEVEVEAWSGPSPLRLDLRDWAGRSLGESGELAVGDVVPLTLAWSGEHALVVGSVDGQPGDYRLAARCVDGCATSTRYPIVLMHGMAGTDEFLEGLTYFYDVVPTLEAEGHAVHAPAVDPFRATPERALGWAAHLDALVASGQARRVNLIGHSQGGLDARYLASKLDPDERVVSVTTIGTPHRGAPIADLSSGILDVSLVGPALLDLAIDELAALYGPRGDQDIEEQLTQLTSEASEAFNDDVLDRANVHYASWAGRTCQLVDLICQSTNGFEVVTPIFTSTQALTWLIDGENDGLVSTRSAIWGDFLGVLPADHLDQVGLFPGTQAPGFDHRRFFVDEATRLVELGF